jgi:hypothetical protein
MKLRRSSAKERGALKGSKGGGTLKGSPKHAVEGAARTKTANSGPSWLWNTHGEGVEVSEGGLLATVCKDDATAETDPNKDCLLVTSGVELCEGKHSWRVEVLGNVAYMFVGVTKPNLPPTGPYWAAGCRDSWLRSLYMSCSLYRRNPLS